MAEGYLFEFQQRGYLRAGAVVPEVVLEHPELVRNLHREFVHAGSNVVQAFTVLSHSCLDLNKSCIRTINGGEDELTILFCNSVIS